MSVTVKWDSSGVNRLAARLESLSAEVDERMMRVAKQEAENMLATAKATVYGPYLQKETGETADSLHEYVERTKEGVAFGVSTDSLRTIYHEMGTGPVGTEAGYPGESNVDEPIVRRSTAWYYWAEDIAKERSGINPGEEHEFSSMQEYFEFQQGGFVKTEGVPPKAFIHNAVMEGMVEAEEAIQAELEEWMNGR